MDIEKHLILLKGEDKTENIVECLPHAKTNNIAFKGKNGTVTRYSYNSKNIEWFKDPVELGVTSEALCVNGIIHRDIQKILRFGDYIRIIFHNGKSCVCKKNELHQQKNNGDIEPVLKFPLQLTHDLDVAEKLHQVQFQTVQN